MSRAAELRKIAEEAAVSRIDEEYNNILAALCNRAKYGNTSWWFYPGKHITPHIEKLKADGFIITYGNEYGNHVIVVSW